MGVFLKNILSLSWSWPAYWQCFGLPSKWAFGAATIYPDSPSFLFSHLHLFNLFLHLFSQPTTLSIQIHLLFSHLHHINPFSQHTPLLPIQISPPSYFLTNISSTFSNLFSFIIFSFLTNNHSLKQEKKTNIQSYTILVSKYGLMFCAYLTVSILN